MNCVGETACESETARDREMRETEGGRVKMDGEGKDGYEEAKPARMRELRDKDGRRRVKQTGKKDK